jgi:8-oxo-dGTP diphosphatase
MARNVVAGVVKEGNKFLVTKRMPGDRFGGFWEFPGGTCSANETLEQCLERELYEELGIRARVFEKLAEVALEDLSEEDTLHFFRCKILTGKPTAKQVDSLAWLAVHQLNEIDLLRADRLFVEKYLETGNSY